jgi:hypothetical protein
VGYTSQLHKFGYCESSQRYLACWLRYSYADNVPFVLLGRHEDLNAAAVSYDLEASESRCLATYALPRRNNCTTRRILSLGTPDHKRPWRHNESLVSAHQSWVTIGAKICLDFGGCVARLFNAASQA